MKIKQLNVEIFSDITEEGIWSSVFIGESDTPVAEHLQYFDDWIEQQIERYTVPNKQYIPYEDANNLKDVFNEVKALRYAADVLEERLMALDGFDRKSWVEAGGLNSFARVDDYLKPMSELLK